MARRQRQRARRPHAAGKLCVTQSETLQKTLRAVADLS